MPTKKKNSPTKKRFCVWADYVRRVYQHVTADTPQQAHDLAKKRVECWDQCDWHDNNGFRLSNEVQDLATDEFIPIHGEKNCKTCGSEIVATINESNFCAGECGACEYQRYTSQPDLLHACCFAEKEIEQWDEVMGGSEDPRTKEALDALQSAIAKAHEKC